MKFDDFKKSLSELDEKLKQANDALATADNDESREKALKDVAEATKQINDLKDTFITEQNNAYGEMESKYNKAEQERLQALKIASDNANKQPPKEKDPRKIFSVGLGGI